MKTLTLITFLLFTGICFAVTEVRDAPKAVVIHIEGMSQQDNISIHKLFYADSKYEVINSCQILGLIVIQNEDNTKINAAEAKAYIQQKVESLSLKSALVFLENKSSMDVSHQCREKVAELHNHK